MIPAAKKERERERGREGREGGGGREGEGGGREGPGEKLVLVLIYTSTCCKLGNPLFSQMRECSGCKLIL